ncbi:AAA family ATPase [Tenacibaculum maritimum]|uniref:AAA family ATPase n=1 Tax=Tenacibaculum maritimum TaxID=107401 RepID=UPI0038762BD2
MKLNLYKEQDTYNINEFYLERSEWDDFSYKTTYFLYYINEEKEFENVGKLKIAQFELLSGNVEIPKSFKQLDDSYFSLGQNKAYYENLNSYGDNIREFILTALNDISLDEELCERASFERVFKFSFTRNIDFDLIENDFRRLAHGNAELSKYNFRYNFPRINKGSEENQFIDFKVSPNSNPPTNIHVLIGRNGVGKTHVLNNMIASLVNEARVNSKYGFFSSNSYRKMMFTKEERIFTNLVSVSFSAFDDNQPPNDRRGKKENIRYSYIGLKRPSSEKNSAPKSVTILKNEFVKSFTNSLKEGKWKRLKLSLNTLSSDPVFNQLGLIKIIEESLTNIDKEFNDEVSNLFKKLSSGHKIVLLTIVRLVETLEERSLVLIDEPETHLHPPLLSAFTRALSNLLINRNAVAIIATHSPVVLQEVPKSCVWKLHKNGTISKFERLNIESFGENVGVLTREVFGLEVTDSGYHKIISEVLDDSGSFKEILSKFNGELGFEAQAIIQGLLNLKNR